MVRKYLPLSIILILFAGTVFSQYFFDSGKSREQKSSPLIPSFEVVHAADLGLDNAAADIYWLAGIQYFGDWQNDRYSKMDDYLNLVTDLNPKFSYPYAFGTLLLPTVGQTDNALTLGQKGLENAPDDWRIPYYLAIDYFIDKKDNLSAAKYFDLAAHTPGAPSNLQQIAASFSSRPDLRQNIEQVWISIYDNSADEVVKDRAKNYVLHYEILDLLENAAQIYKQKTGSYPASVSDLVSAKILNSIPIDPFGYQYSIDSSGRAAIN